MSQDLDQKAYYLYQLAKDNPHDENLQLAANLLKSTRRSQGSFRRWNERYREDISDLGEQVQQQEDVNLQLKEELNILSQDLRDLTQQKIQMAKEREKINAQLREIETEVTMAVAKVKQSKTLHGKFSALWSFMNSLFLDNEDMGELDYSIKVDSDNPQLGSSIADVQKSLLDK